MERWRFPATEAGPQGSQERRRETHTEEQRPTDEQTGGQRQKPGGKGPGRSWERQEPGASDLHALQSPETSLCSLGCCRAQPDAGSLAAWGPGGPSAPGLQPWGSRSRQGVGGGLGRCPRGGAGEGGPDAKGELLRTLMGNCGCGREGIPGLGKWARVSDGTGSKGRDDGFRQGTRGQNSLL